MNERILDQIFEESPSYMVIVSWPELRYLRSNEEYFKLLGRRDIVGKFVKDVIPDWQRQGLLQVVERVATTQQRFMGTEVLIKIPNDDSTEREEFFDFVYQPLIGEDGKTFAILSQGHSVTEKVLARRELEQSKFAIENERENFRNLFKQTPEMVCILRGPDHVFEFVNEAHVKALGFDATGKSVREAQPESVEVHGILDNVYQTGKTAELHEIPVTVTNRVRYFNLTYSARRDEFGKINGVMILGTEVTREVILREQMRESEALFRHLVDDSPAIMWITDADAKCVYLSRQWYLTTGGSPETDLGFGWVDQVHPEDKEAAGKAFFNAVNARGRISIRYRLRQKDGSYRWAVDSGLPRTSSDGTFLGYIGTVVDIHDQVSSEGELRAVQKTFEKSAAATNLGVWYCDLPFNELQWNREVKEHFFMKPDAQVTIDSFYAHIHPEDREMTRSAINNSIETRTPYDVVYRTHDPHFPTLIKWVRAIGWTTYDADGKPIRFDGITIDVTKEQIRENELKAAKEEAERANELKSAFLANMSHEIRTPLGAMIGFADLLRDPNLTTNEKANYLNILSRNGEQLSVIINDILDLSKVEAGHLTLEFTETYPDQIAADIVSLLRVKAKEKDLALEYFSESSTPEKIVSDPTRVRQVLLNLVSNAVKFTQFGSVKIRSYGCKSDSGLDSVCFEIEDTGIGVPDSQKERIFEMFVQADGSMTRRFGGTGLGLALSRKLARSLGGDVSVIHSEEGKGATFLFKIEDQPHKRSADAPPLRAKIVDSPPISENALDGMKILVVDDAPDNQQLIWRYLTRQGATVASAENGFEGYKKALGGEFDVVLMDIQMPLMDGYTATEKLRSAGYRKPIIALTAHAMTEVRKKCLNVGCTDHLTKPINSKELIQAIVRSSTQPVSASL